MGPPSEYPKRTARSEPHASSTARTSSIRSSSGDSRGDGSDRPVSRLSNRISRPSEASPRKNDAATGSSHHRSRWLMMPGTKMMSRSPSPSTWYAMCTSPLRAYCVTGIRGAAGSPRAAASNVRRSAW